MRTRMGWTPLLLLLPSPRQQCWGGIVIVSVLLLLLSGAAPAFSSSSSSTTSGGMQLLGCRCRVFSGGERGRGGGAAAQATATRRRIGFVVVDHFASPMMPHPTTRIRRDDRRYYDVLPSAASLRGQQQQSSPRRTSGDFFFRVAPLAAMAVTIRIVGTKRSSASSSTSWIEDGCNTYQKRLQGSSIQLATDWSKTDDDLVKAVRLDETKGHAVVMLDPLGTSLTSEEFAKNLYKWLERGGSRLTFVIGGAHGLPKELLLSGRDRGGSTTGKGSNGNGAAPTLISLSDLTFTHQMARLLLVEQIYRASEIRRGSGYHK